MFTSSFNSIGFGLLLVLSFFVVFCFSFGRFCWHLGFFFRWCLGSSFRDKFFYVCIVFLHFFTELLTFFLYLTLSLDFFVGASAIVRLHCYFSSFSSFVGSYITFTSAADFMYDSLVLLRRRLIVLVSLHRHLMVLVL
ncbi:hypothetical protein C2G38_1177954 [Gigaspora rosea]|uniref:Uncharacterized protein n=1 Tax=Gigaspora rosea TaxID=44941 RepID=A0A397VN57_9GLOM|nr:hypothetical protein C2G38_1177954 [Gigaspora rosea]